MRDKIFELINQVRNTDPRRAPDEFVSDDFCKGYARSLEALKDELENVHLLAPYQESFGEISFMDDLRCRSGWKLLDHGAIRLIEKWGSDRSIIEAARMSTDKGFLGWDPGPCPACDGSGCNSCDDKGTVRGDQKLLQFLYRNKHSTPFEMAGLTIEVQAPIMVFREWHRHRTQSYSELSARYTPMPDLNYIPSVERIMMSSGGANKQAGTAKGAAQLTNSGAVEFRKDLERVYANAQELYEKALGAGIPKELARVHLPVGRYSRMRATANLRNWLGFLTLRTDDKAQWEIRQYALKVDEMVKTYFPRTHALYVEGKQ